MHQLTSLCNMQEEADAGLLSNAQMEVVGYALQRFRGERTDKGTRAGFFLGDGAGVGKGVR
jgi:P-loop containing NTP hydrolase pore-1